MKLLVVVDVVTICQCRERVRATSESARVEMVGRRLDWFDVRGWEPENVRPSVADGHRLVEEGANRRLRHQTSSAQ